MFARSTTVAANPATLDRGIEFVSTEVWPTMSTIDGFLGISLLADRDDGRLITTTSWRDLDAMRATESTASPLREKGAGLMEAGAPSVAEWEIASMHRAHHAQPGTCVRAAWSRVPRAKLEGAIDFYKYVLLPDVEQMRGFVSASLMVDRATGSAVTSVAFETREDMLATRDKADYLRAMSTNEANVEFLDVEEFELVLAHLHVPETV